MTEKTKTDPVSQALAPISERNLPILSERFQPRNLTELMSWAKLYVRSGLAPRGKKFEMNEAAVVICVQMGAELDISPSQAIQNIAVINGKPSIYGDLGKAIFFRDASYKTFEDRDPKEALEKGEGWCRIEMKNGRIVERHYTIEAAKTAGLWGKEGPWQTDPGVMLQWRACWRAMRDTDPGVFKGCRSREEMEDFEPIGVTAEGVQLSRPRPKTTRDPAEGGVDPGDVDAFLKETEGGVRPGSPATQRRSEGTPDPEKNPHVGKLKKVDKVGTGPLGRNKKPKWELYSIDLEDGSKFTTLDRGLAKTAFELGTGSEVEVTWERTDKGHLNATAVEPHMEPAESEPEPDSEEPKSRLFEE